MNLFTLAAPSGRPLWVALPVALAAALALSACGGSDSPAPLLTLDGAVPLIIGHRGLPGLYPEETLPSYDDAVDAGADSLEQGLHLSKDCVLMARHNPWLSDNTNTTEIAKTKTRRWPRASVPCQGCWST